MRSHRARKLDTCLPLEEKNTFTNYTSNERAIKTVLFFYFMLIYFSSGEKENLFKCPEKLF